MRELKDKSKNDLVKVLLTGIRKEELKKDLLTYGKSGVVGSIGIITWWNRVHGHLLATFL